MSQTGRAALVLREMLLEGHFQPGERIREVPLAAELGVSRIPLRLVLERLAHEGLLEVRPTRGFVVQRFSATDIYDAIELRGLLEGMAARLTAEKVQELRRHGQATELPQRPDRRGAAAQIDAGVSRAIHGVERKVPCGNPASLQLPDATARDGPRLFPAVRLAERVRQAPVPRPGVLGALPHCDRSTPGHSGCDHKSRGCPSRDACPGTRACRAPESGKLRSRTAKSPNSFRG